MFEFGLDGGDVIECAGTGLVVNIFGTGEMKNCSLHTIALRADMDGLPIPENNPGLEYRTQTDHAHMCGHDGHMATILSTAQVLIQNRHKIPKN